MRLILSLLIFSQCLFANRPNPDFIDISSRFLFVPVGFDSNDEVMVVLDGYLPNTCYRLTQPEIKGLDTPQIQKIQIQVLAYIAKGNCLPFAVPFTQQVRLGRLAPSDKYEISTNGGKLIEKLIVNEAKPSVGIDDFNYAPVESVEVVARNIELEGKQTRVHFAVLKGRLTNTCLRVAKIKASTSNGKTVEVLPLLEELPHGPNEEPCAFTEREFTEEVALPALSLGRHLVHVRTAGGQALNRVFTNLVP